MAPGTEPGGDSFEGTQFEEEHGFEPRYGFFRVGTEFYPEVRGVELLELLGRALDVE